MPINIVKYVLDLLQAILRGDKVVNPFGASVAHPAGVETKVTAAASGAVVGNLLGGIVNILPVPDWVKGVIRLLLPALGASALGYLAPHTERTLRARTASN